MPVPNPDRFLVIDDNGDSRMLLVKTLLRKFPDAVLQECQNGETAVRIAQTDPLTAIIAHRTFDFDGEALVMRLRQVNRNVPIVMVSGYDRSDKVISAGADTFLHYDAWLQIGNVVAQVIARRAESSSPPGRANIGDLTAPEFV